jgi:hypothetical protein
MIQHYCIYDIRLIQDEIKIQIMNHKRSWQHSYSIASNNMIVPLLQLTKRHKTHQVGVELGNKRDHNRQALSYKNDKSSRDQKRY